MRSKKGSAMDIVMLPAIIFFVAVCLMVGLYLMEEAYPKFQAEIDSSPIANESVTETYEAAKTGYDYIFLAIYVGLIMSIVVLSFQIDVHPIFMVFALIMMSISILVAVPISNAYQLLATEMAQTSNFTITYFIMSKLPYFTLLIGGLAIVMTYAGKKLLRVGYV